MSAAAGLLQAVRETPEDDGPRLVYADWLEENGELERAEFIRLQCQLARLPEYDPRREALVEREQELFARHRAKWTPELPTFARRARHEFRRGFLSHLWLDTKELLRSPARLFAVTPLDSLELGNAHRHIQELAESPYLARLTALRLIGFQAEHLGTLFRSPHLTRLRSLLVDGSWIGLEGARHLSAWPGLAGLTSLSLARRDIGVPGVQLVLGSRHLGRLESLDLSELVNSRGKLGLALAQCERLDGLRRLVLSTGPLRYEGLADLATAPWLTGLETLDVSRLPVGEGGVTALTRSPSLGNLRDLNLSQDEIGSAGAVTLARSRWDRLVRLELAFCNVGEQGARALAEAPALANLRRLALAYNKLSDAGARHLADSPCLGQLTHLELAGNDLSIEGVRALLESDRLSNLTSLSLSSNRRLAADVPRLAELPGLRRLRRLSLNGLNMGPDHALALVRSPHLDGLSRLDLGNNQVDNRVAIEIATSPRFAGLTELYLYVGTIDGDGVRALARSPHLGRLRVLDISSQRQGLDGDAVLALAWSSGLGSILRLRVPTDSPPDLGLLRQRFGERAVNTY